jgi:primosomal replication protein N
LNCNQTVICGEITEISGLRYTPAGVAVAEFKINHASRQIEAGQERRVGCELSAVALAQQAERIGGMMPGIRVRLTGFLARRSRMSPQLVLHVNNLEHI